MPNGSSTARRTDPIALALAFAIRRAVARQAAEDLERRRSMALVEGGKRGGAPA